MMRDNFLARLSLATFCFCFLIGCVSETQAQWPSNEVLLRNGTTVKAFPLMGVDANYVDLGDNRKVYRADVSVICLYDCKGAPRESFSQDLLVFNDGRRKFGKIKLIKGWTDNYIVMSGKKFSFINIRYIKFADPVPDDKKRRR